MAMAIARFGPSSSSSLIPLLSALTSTAVAPSCGAAPSAAFGVAAAVVSDVMHERSEDARLRVVHVAVVVTQPAVRATAPR